MAASFPLSRLEAALGILWIPVFGSRFSCCLNCVFCLFFPPFGYPFPLFFCPLMCRKLVQLSSCTSFLSGGDEGDRTLYLLNAIQALSQVSYAPRYILSLYIGIFRIFSFEFLLLSLGRTLDIPDSQVSYAPRYDFSSLYRHFPMYSLLNFCFCLRVSHSMSRTPR